MTNEELLTTFQAPGVEWRGKPFWSWNGTLDEAELIRQVEVLQRMGMGGFFMHSRTGLVTEYLGDEWLRLTNACADHAEKLGMEAWLYDEDRWPSGTAGGLVTSNPAYRLHFMSLRPVPGAEFKWEEHPDIVAAFAGDLEGIVCFGVRRITPETSPAEYAHQTVLTFTVEPMAPSSFYNGFTYVDTMNPDATNDFINRTHEKYRAACGDRFGKSIQGIFTDEPHRGAAMTGFSVPNENRLWMTPWTETLPATYQALFGEDILEKLPDLFLQVDGKAVSPVKWRYMEVTQQLFLQNFAKPLYEWCDAHNLRLTGHVLHEDSLTAQAAMQGSLMRFYEYQHDPGVDLLTEGNRTYWGVKHLQSAARQIGRRMLMSELYGCTGWQMDFQAHKAVGDWQALLGINLRCHHLSWYTMAGEAKRDYPASIFYQSAWWQDYPFVEDYFSRLGVILAEGEPCCETLVLNPIESVWCQIHAGWAHSLSPQPEPIKALEKQYAELFHWLAGSQIDFDYGDEEMLHRLGGVEKDSEGKPVLRLGNARYQNVVVGGLTTIRGTSLALLRAFAAAGGTVIFAGDVPDYVDAVPDVTARELADQTMHIAWTKEAIASALRPQLQWDVQITNAESGAILPDIFCQLRRDDSVGRLYLVAMNMSTTETLPHVRIRVSAPELANAELWDCRTGKLFAVTATRNGDSLEILTDFPSSGERVFAFSKIPTSDILPAITAESTIHTATCDGPYFYTLSEPNVCVLDRARWQIGKKEWQEPLEVLKIDQSVRHTFDLPLRSGEMVQPWYREKYLAAATHEVKDKVTLAYDFMLDYEPIGDLFLCVERPALWHITVNGKTLDNSKTDGWWIDTAFPKIPLPVALLRSGKNIIQLETDFNEGMDIEASYLLGNFGVQLSENESPVLTQLPLKLSVGSVTEQGLPFYGGAITYYLPVPDASEPPDNKAYLVLPEWAAACAKIEGKYIAFAPFETEITKLLTANGTSQPKWLKTLLGFWAYLNEAMIAVDNILPLEVVLTRRNTFGPLHQVPLRAGAYGPGNFVTTGDNWNDVYQLWPSGLLKAPEIQWRKAAK
jgi:hypothetical protein